MMLDVSRNMRKRVLALAALMLAVIAVDAMGFPSARRNTGMVWSDEARGIILFGGLSPLDSANKRYEFGDTWRFTASKWVRLYPENSPSPRYAMSVVYDSNRNRVLLYGGAAGDEFLGDTWIFREGNWNQLDTPSAPPARRLAGMAFDPIRDKAVLFGGGVGESRFFDTWEFDGTTWNLIDDDGPRVEMPTLVYDGARDEVLMVGTESSKVAMYRYVDGSWSKMTPETLPSCVGQIQMVYRPFDRTVLLYGGSCPRGGISNDTWIWDGTDWEELDLKRSAGALFGYGLAHDPTRNHTVLYGGTSVMGGTSALEDHDTYRLSGDRWIRLDTRVDPGPRTQFVLQSSPSDEHLLFFGGQNAVDFFADFWKLNNLNWEQVEPEGTAPKFCSSPLGAIDPDRNQLVILCADSSTYEFDGQELVEKTSTDFPKPRRFAVMEWDPISRRVIMYGGLDDFGAYLDETWAWDGTQWKKLDLKREQKPGARILPTMFTDPNTNRIVLAGGLGRPDFDSDFIRYEDQWQFDGTRWIEMNPAQKLPQRYGAQVAVDPENQRVLVFGGKSNTETYLNDMWMWDGTTWSEVDDGPAPSPRMNGRMAWDPSTGKIVLYGGYAGLYYSELWTFDGGWTRVEPDATLRPRRPVRRPSSSPTGSSSSVSAPVDVSPPRNTGPLAEELR